MDQIRLRLSIFLLVSVAFSVNTLAQDTRGWIGNGLGASLAGGVGTIFGAFLGVLLMALLQNAMIIAHISPFWQLIVVGIVLLISVGLDQFARIRLRS